MTEEFGFDKPREEFDARVKALVQAIAFAIDTTDINDALPEGLRWEFDTVDSNGAKLGEFSLEGYRDENHDDGVEVVIQIKHVNFGPHRLLFEPIIEPPRELDPEPWVVRSADNGEMRTSSDKPILGYRHLFQPREGYEQDREHYEEVNNGRG